MRELQIEKKDLQKQLWPLSFEGTLIFKTSFFGQEGFFGIRDNYLIFISDDQIPKEININLPENLEEVQGFLSSAEYLLNRVMLTPEIHVEGFVNKEIQSDQLRTEVITIFSNFIQLFSKNAVELEKIKNGW